MMATMHPSPIPSIGQSGRPAGRRGARIWALAGLWAASMCAIAPVQAQEVTLKFHHIWNPQAMASVNVIAPWCDKIARESNNRIKCQILTGSRMAWMMW